MQKSGASWLPAALSFIRTNFRGKISIADVAGQVGRSPRRLAEHLRRETGKTFTRLLLDLRLDEARRMLSRTDVPIREIAGSVGFSRLDYFSAVFRKAEGVSPRTYRDRNRIVRRTAARRREETKGMAVFRTDFREKTALRHWDGQGGTWHVRNRVLEGSSAGDVFATLRRDLPTSFRVDLELARLASDDPTTRGSLMLALCDGTPAMERGYWFYLGGEHNGVYRLDREGVTVAVYPARFPPGGWHRLSIVLTGDRLELLIDGKAAFDHREFLQLPLRDRSRLTLGTWAATLRIRRLVVSSLPPPRGQDSLHLADERAAEGKYEQALQTYESEMEKVRGTDRETDLLLRAGAASLRLGLRIRARSYLDRFVARHRGDLWSTMAAIMALETRLDDLRDEELVQQVEEILRAAPTPECRMLVLDFISRARETCAARGNYERLYRVSRFLYESSPASSHEAAHGAQSAALALFCMQRYDELRDFSTAVLGEGNLDPAYTEPMILHLTAAHTAAGRYDEAARTLDGLRQTEERFAQARLAVRRASLLQARGELEAALSAYRDIAREFEDVSTQASTGASCAAHLLTLAGKADEAPGLIERHYRATTPQHLRMRFLTECSLLAIAGRHEELLAAVGSRTRGEREATRESIRDELLLCILYELTGDRDRAERNLEVLERTLRAGPLWRFVQPASYLLGKVSAEEMRRNAPWFDLFLSLDSSSLFTMLARVEKKRGRQGAAKQLLRYAIDVDPFNYWASLLARRELGELTPAMKAFLGC